MNEKELKKLNRAELLELLLVQTRKNEKLKQKLQKAEEELAERRLKVENAGNLAQAALVINEVMEAAQKAADQYLENIAAMEAETKEKCEKMLAEAASKAEISVPEENASEESAAEKVDYDQPKAEEAQPEEQTADKAEEKTAAEPEKKTFKQKLAEMLARKPKTEQANEGEKV